jgi:NAD-dependent DNA ligase
MFCIADIYEKIIELAPAEIKNKINDSRLGHLWSEQWEDFLEEKYPERERKFNSEVAHKVYYYPKEAEADFWKWLPSYFEDLKNRRTTDKQKLTPPLPEDAANTDNCFCNTKICFTGFDAAEKIKIEKICKTLNITKISDVSKSMDYLICGATAGASKIRKAIANKNCIVPVEYFIEIISEK